MSEANATGLEPIVESLQERAVVAAGEKTPEGAREAQICGFIAKYLAALDKAWKAEDEATRTKADDETRKTFEDFRRGFDRDLTMEDIASHVDGLSAGGSLETGIRMSLGRLAAQGTGQP
jgi:hypothetical protein